MANFWEKQDAYNPNGAWNGKGFCRVIGGRWAKYDAVVSSEKAEPLPTNCLTFSSPEAFTIATYNTTKNWDGTLYYSIDTETWSEWDGSTAIASAEHGGEQRIYMRGSSNSVITGAYEKRWVLTDISIRCDGNIENLLDYETVANGEHPTMAEGCYASMFSGCTALTSAPELPATTLVKRCYSSMFKGTSLVTAPELPATTLADTCYDYMFQYCTSLVTAPELPATTLAEYCYMSMFIGCTSLVTAPELPATTLADTCYGYMFQDCTSLVTAPELPATTLASQCYYNMFKGCTSLIAAPELPATTLATSCYACMFQNCTNLITAYALPTTILESKCYYSMFRGCSSLVTIPALPATTLTSQCYYNMFRDCTNIKLSQTESDEYPNAYRIPTEGTGTTASSALNNMFSNTGGTFKGTPSINTTYYTNNTVV